jgi:hypothetical protein
MERAAVVERPHVAADEPRKAPDPSDVQAAADVLERTFEARLGHWRRTANSRLGDGYGHPWQEPGRCIGAQLEPHWHRVSQHGSRSGRGKTANA